MQNTSLEEGRKMLKVVKTVDLGHETIETSPYSFALDWPDSLGHPFYWRAGLVSGSLLEIGIHFRTGRIKSISLPLVKQASSWPTDRLSITAMEIPEQTGAPVFFVEDAWISDPDSLAFDTSEDFLVCVGEHKIAIDLGSYERVVSRIRGDKVNFGLDHEGFLHMIEIENLTDEAMSNLRQHLQFPGS